MSDFNVLSIASVGYGITNTPSMHRRLGSSTLSQLASPGGKQQEFPMGAFPKRKYSCLKKKKKKKKKKRERAVSQE